MRFPGETRQRLAKRSNGVRVELARRATQRIRIGLFDMYLEQSPASFFVEVSPAGTRHDAAAMSRFARSVLVALAIPGQLGPPDTIASS